MAIVTTHFQRTKLITSSTDKHYSLDSLRTTLTWTITLYELQNMGHSLLVSDHLQDLLSRLSEAKKDGLLRKLLSNDHGSLDYANSLIEAEENGGPQPNNEVVWPDWCYLFSVSQHGKRGGKQVLWEENVLPLMNCSGISVLRGRFFI